VLCDLTFSDEKNGPQLGDSVLSITVYVIFNNLDQNLTIRTVFRPICFFLIYLLFDLDNFSHILTLLNDNEFEV